MAEDIDRPMEHIALQRAGIDQDVTPHLLRHTFASRFLR
jgi:site-specific recombinase XerD